MTRRVQVTEQPEEPLETLVQPLDKQRASKETRPSSPKSQNVPQATNGPKRVDNEL